MKRILKLTALSAFLLILAGGLVSCNDLNPYTEKEDPQEIPFETFSLAGTSCRWGWVRVADSTTLIIVNSNEHLENHISCSSDNRPEIDFSKNTLLLLRGIAPNTPSRVVDTIFFRNARNEYTLDITVHHGHSRALSWWNVFILVPKIADRAIVNLNIKQTYGITD